MCPRVAPWSADINVLGAIAEFERDLVRDRVVADMRSAQRRSGRSLREIASLLGVSKSTIGRALADAKPSP
jgi:DNA invertase Pin-like site-specific DNA recombinase